ncbi:hypothetical protein LY76DRAFT_52163 [Colletotrichum caudatum]|nr:hypothetical protein LY76DRAFT_52163 [Colletotrichum caudatum]
MRAGGWERVDESALSRVDEQPTVKERQRDRRTLTEIPQGVLLVWGTDRQTDRQTDTPADQGAEGGLCVSGRCGGQAGMPTCDRLEIESPAVRPALDRSLTGNRLLIVGPARGVVREHGIPTAGGPDPGLVCTNTMYHARNVTVWLACLLYAMLYVMVHIAVVCC